MPQILGSTGGHGHVVFSLLLLLQAAFRDAEWLVFIRFEVVVGISPVPFAIVAHGFPAEGSFF